MTAEKRKDAARRHPIRAAVFRGLAVVLPPLLTIVIFLWVLSTVQQYVLRPFTAGVRELIVLSIADIRKFDELPEHEQTDQVKAEKADDPAERDAAKRRLDFRAVKGEVSTELPPGEEPRWRYVPKHVYEKVKDDRRVETMPATAKEVYRRYVELTYLQPYQVIPYFLCGFILVLYLLGKFMAAGVGRFFWGSFERGIIRVPLVSNVYSAVKQVSDFVLSEREVEASRVVAVEWPRKGIWCLALVTGSSLRDVQAAAKEEVLSVLIPTSPMPMTGFTVTVKRSETIDLDITIDQAIQFIVSCGVVVPPGQLQQMQGSKEAGPQLIAAGESPPSGPEDA